MEGQNITHAGGQDSMDKKKYDHKVQYCKDNPRVSISFLFLGLSFYFVSPIPEIDICGYCGLIQNYFSFWVD